MVRKPTQQGQSDDIKALSSIARTLLGLENGGGVRGTIGLLAEDFTRGSSDKKVDDLLQVSFKGRNHLLCSPLMISYPAPIHLEMFDHTVPTTY